MGVSTQDLTFTGVRTLEGERDVELYVPPPGTKYLHLVGRRDPIDGNGPIVSRVMKVIYWLSGCPTSAHHHLQGIGTTPEKAEAAARSYEGGYAIRMPVDAFFPAGRIDWKFQFKGKGLNLNRDGGEPEMYEVVKRGELIELDEWRSGKRKTAEVERMLNQLDCLTRLSRLEKDVDTKLGDLNHRLERLEKGRRPVTGNLIASALPPLDASSFPYYVVLLAVGIKGAAKGYEWLTDFLEKRKKGKADEIGRITEGAVRTREEAEHLIELQEKTISRQDAELAAALRKGAEAAKEAEDLKAQVAKLDAKLASAGRQWFEREGFIDELGRRIKKLEDGTK
jgi:CRISPR/Cas system CSM-associated protein Csm2 small subunit